MAHARGWFLDRGVAMTDRIRAHRGRTDTARRVGSATAVLSGRGDESARDVDQEA
jgi:hypothetical protein